MVHLSRREHHNAQQPTSHLPVPGPSDIHLLRIIPEHISTRPEIVLADGDTLIQPRLPAMLHGVVQQAHADTDSYDDRDIIAPDCSPPPDPGQHGHKRAAQWLRWQTKVLPALLIPRKSCACVGRALKIAVVHFTSIDNVTLNVCPCHPAAVQLIKAGAFSCAPVSPSLAVDLRVLEFTGSLFVQIAPNNTAFVFALETVLANMGFQLNHKNSLHLCNLHKQRYGWLIEDARLRHLTETHREWTLPPETPPPEDAEECGRAAACAELPPDWSCSSTCHAPPAGRKRNRAGALRMTE
ncbi:hypothetical protein DFH07DRAFT_968415 [Mycena maculata]|uniref:CxC1-like cysteine cluster associated with KDZ transposases domain-containing protein n=1 Tax=Mycena maculata TaxID=230809 RepID=A0AAD7I2B8_9AGAR|nr:hypothetical protein DFH07DRAFT_968415 [Mycena maculata]